MWCDGGALVRGLALPGWQPEPDWALGLHASHAYINDVIWVDNVKLASGALRSAADVPVFLSRNGQQFEAVAHGTFGYRAPAMISTISPHAGPLAFETSIVVHGANLPGGSDYRCVFGGRWAPARLNETDGSIRCAAPPQPDALLAALLDPVTGDRPNSSIRLPLRISHNGVDLGPASPFECARGSAPTPSPRPASATAAGHPPERARSAP